MPAGHGRLLTARRFVLMPLAPLLEVVVFDGVQRCVIVIEPSLKGVGQRWPPHAELPLAPPPVRAQHLNGERVPQRLPGTRCLAEARRLLHHPEGALAVVPAGVEFGDSPWPTVPAVAGATVTASELGAFALAESPDDAPL